MASLTWQELIDRAKTYVDDDHQGDKGWIADERWLQLAQVEYRQLYRRWLRGGLVTPLITTNYMQGESTVFPNVLALIGVAKDYGDYVRILSRAGSRDAIWRGSTQPAGYPTSYTAVGLGSNLVITLDRAPDDLTSTNYVVKYVPAPITTTDPTAFVELPDGGDERLVLGLAKRAHLKDSGASALLNDLIREADAEMTFTAAGTMGGLKVQTLRPARRSTPRGLEWPGCAQWLYLNG